MWSMLAKNTLLGRYIDNFENETWRSQKRPDGVFAIDVTELLIFSWKYVYLWTGLKKVIKNIEKVWVPEIRVEKAGVL